MFGLPQSTDQDDADDDPPANPPRWDRARFESEDGPPAWSDL